MRPGNYQLVQLTDKTLERYLTGEFVIVDGLPTDAELVTIRFNNSLDLYEAIFEHESFDFVAEDQKIPAVGVSVVRKKIDEDTHYICPNCFSTELNGEITEHFDI